MVDGLAELIESGEVRDNQDHETCFALHELEA
jgi:hypothetical protein